MEGKVGVGVICEGPESDLDPSNRVDDAMVHHAITQPQDTLPRSQVSDVRFDFVLLPIQLSAHDVRCQSIAAGSLSQSHGVEDKRSEVSIT